MEQVLVTVVLAFPTGLVIAEPADEPGGLPKLFERASRVSALHGLVVENITVALDPDTQPGNLRDHFPHGRGSDRAVGARVPW